MIKSIALTDFRKFDKLELNKLSNLVILSGNNAVGKTSVLEAILLSSTLKSHRTNDLCDLIHFESPFTVLEINGDKKIKIVISKEGKSLYVNGAEVKKLTEFVGNINACMISPEDMSLIKGSKQDKRRFLDINISLLDKNYLYELSKYRKLLVERNSLLKSSNPDKIALGILTDDLACCLNVIYSARIKFIKQLNDYLQDICKNLKSGEIKLIYKPTYNPNDIKKSFDSRLQGDLMLKVTQIGSHRDTFDIMLDSHDAGVFASEGQSRICYIALKLALKMVLSQKEEPVLLLDDIYSSLDSSKIEALTEYVSKSKQVFITTTSIMNIPDDILRNAVVIRIEK